jgi:hypothetical protein
MPRGDGHLMTTVTFYLGHGQVSVHLNDLKHLNDLVKAKREGVKLAKDVHLTEVKLTFLRLGLQAALHSETMETTQSADITQCFTYLLDLQLLTNSESSFLTSHVLQKINNVPEDVLKTVEISFDLVDSKR